MIVCDIPREERFMNAAELDRLVVAQEAHQAALDAGKTEQEALDAARKAAYERRRVQVLRSVGLSDDEIEATRVRA